MTQPTSEILALLAEIEDGRNFLPNTDPSNSDPMVPMEWLTTTVRALAAEVEKWEGLAAGENEGFTQEFF